MNISNSPEQPAFLASLKADEGLDPLMDHLKVYGAPSFDEQGAGIELRLEACHMNGGQSAHGGLIMMLLDVVMACSTSRDGRHCVTVELKCNFMKPGGKVGDLLRAKGIVRATTRSLAFCDGEIRNEGGELLATASGTFKYVRPLHSLDPQPVRA